MKLFLEYLGYALGGCVMMVGSVLYLLDADADFWHGAAAVGICLAGAVVALSVVLLMIRDRGEFFARPLGDEVMLHPERLAADLPFSALSAQFAEIAPLDEGVGYNNPPGFLGWNSGQFSTLHLLRLGSGEDWYALFWVRHGQALTDRQLERICRMHGLTLDTSFRQMEAHGLAVFQGGQLFVYPALKAEEFREAFMESVLARGRAFRQWVDEYYLDGQYEEEEKEA